MKKLLSILLACMLALGCLTAGAESLPEVKIAVAFYQIDSAALQVQDYLQNYVAPALNVTFMFSEAIDNVDKLINFMDNAYAAGCQGIMNYQNSSVEQAISKALELEMYIATNTTTAVENGDIPFNMGMSAADAKYCADQFGGMISTLFEDGEVHNVVIVSAGAGMGNNEHKYSTIAILEMLQNIYGLTYTEDIETLATTRTQIDCANDKDVLITIYPGYPTGDTYVPGMSTILQSGKYDTVLACNAAYAKFSVAIDEVEKATGKDIRVSAITAINDTTKAGFSTTDSTGHASLNSAILMPSVSTAASLFALVYNGITGYADRFRQDDTGYYYNSPKWVCPDADSYARLEKINSSADTWEVSIDELKQMLAAFNPDANLETMQQQMLTMDADYILEARGL